MLRLIFRCYICRSRIPYGFYDRKTNEFTETHTSYIDNLALTDLYLAHIRRLLERRGQWDSSTIVVMGDHGWRTKLIWKSSSGWTDEDEAANADGQDERPALMVKLPNQHDGARYDGRFEAIRTRGLLDAVMRGQVRTPEELHGWAERQK
jgi:arylsulfatase A-like enzyme